MAIEWTHRYGPVIDRGAHTVLLKDVPDEVLDWLSENWRAPYRVHLTGNDFGAHEYMNLIQISGDLPVDVRKNDDYMSWKTSPKGEYKRMKIVNVDLQTGMVGNYDTESMSSKNREKQIFKVQLSLFTSTAERMCLIYNEDRTLFLQRAADVSIEQAMQGSEKQFFYGHVEGDKIHLDYVAPWQSW